MPGRKPDLAIADIENNLASLSEIVEAAEILLRRLRSPADLAETQRILSAVERIQAREKERRAQAQQCWK